ncbi:MAG: signal peptidase I [Candidatus Kapabacteria bacterium]|nr:signal peptidase I [Candidatus Kapabacteria bacterium]
MYNESSKKDTSIAEIFQDINFRSVIEVSFIIIAIVLFLKSFVLEFYRVESGSMEPELYKGDIVIVSRIAYFLGLPTRFPLTGTNTGADKRIYYRHPKLGDIVIIDAAVAPNLSASNFIIKRIVGLPGDTVIISKSENLKRYHLKRNSIASAGESFIIPKSEDVIRINESNFSVFESILKNEGLDGKKLLDSFRVKKSYNTKYKFKNNYYFVQGDNTMNSLDSRAFGLIPEKAIIGRAVILLVSGNVKNQKSRHLRIL